MDFSVTAKNVLLLLMFYNSFLRDFSSGTTSHGKRLTNDDMPSSVSFPWHCFMYLQQKLPQHFSKTV